MARKSEASFKASLLLTSKPESIVHNQGVIMELLLEIRDKVELVQARIEGFKAMVKAKEQKSDDVDPLPL